MKIGLFFGSFNPIHTGHLIISQYMVNEAQLDKVLFIVSPQNPLKINKDLMPAEFRLKMARLSIQDNIKFDIEDIEFNMSIPSYTIDTLTQLKIKYPQDSLYIIMGSDSVENIHKWRDFEKILDFPILVYKRDKEFVNMYSERENVKIFESPVLNISATKIRQMLQENKSIKYLVKDEVAVILEENKNKA